MLDNTLKSMVQEALQRNGNGKIITESATLNWSTLQDFTTQLNALVPSECTIIFSLCQRGAESLTALLFSILFEKTFFPINPQSNEKELEIAVAGLHGVMIIDSETAAQSAHMSFPPQVSQLIIIDVSKGTLQKKVFSTLQHNSSQMRRAQYIYTTSGSTGDIKRVLGNGEALADFLRWEIKCFSMREQDVFLQLTRPFFDPYLREVLVPLLIGADIAIPSESTALNPQLIASFIQKQHVSVIHTVPSVFRILAQVFAFSAHDLRYVLLAGEALYSETIRSFAEQYPDVIIVNLYGPTETTLAKYYKVIHHKDLEHTLLPVGKPIGDKLHTEAYLDGEEIILCTEAASFGYTDETLTAKAFFEQDGILCYRTNDCGHFLSNGDLVVDGRVDSVVKFHGEKINLEKMATSLCRLEAVKQACVQMITMQGQPVLVAAVIMKPSYSAAQFREKMVTQLQIDGFHHIPAAYVERDVFPQLPNGKIDKRRLKAEMSAELATDFKAENSLARQISDIISDCIGLPQQCTVTVEDKLIHLGVDSLSMMSIIMAIEDTFDVTVDESIWDLQTLRLQDIIDVVDVSMQKTGE